MHRNSLGSKKNKLLCEPDRSATSNAIWNRLRSHPTMFKLKSLKHLFLIPKEIYKTKTKLKVGILKKSWCFMARAYLCNNRLDKKKCQLVQLRYHEMQILNGKAHTQSSRAFQFSINCCNYKISKPGNLKRQSFNNSKW